MPALYKQRSRIVDLGWMAYAVLCFAFWGWLLQPHPIPHGQWANTMATIVIIGSIVFGLGGVLLNEKMLGDAGLELPLKLALYGLAAFLAFMVQFAFRGTPESLAAWTLDLIMFLSFASALYLFIRAFASRLLLMS